MADDCGFYSVDGCYRRIAYGKGLYHRLHLFSTEIIWHPIMYLRDDKLNEYTKAEVKEIFDKFVEHLTRKYHDGTHDNGIIVVDKEGAFIRCFDNGKMIGFLHIPEEMVDDLKGRLTVEFITEVAKKVFKQDGFDADFGLYYCDSICHPEAKLADYYYNWNGLKIRAMECMLECCQETRKTIHLLEKEREKLENEQNRLLQEENQRMMGRIRQLEEEIRRLKI